MRLVITALLLTAPLAAAQDMARFYEAQAALDNGDCELAAKLFEALTGPIRGEERFLRSAAKAHACASSLDKAKTYLEELQRRFPQDEGIAKDLGSISYRLRVKNEQTRLLDERKRGEQERAKQRNDFERGVCLRGCETSLTLCRNDASQRQRSCWAEEGSDCGAQGRDDHQQCFADKNNCEASCRQRWGE